MYCRAVDRALTEGQGFPAYLFKDWGKYQNSDYPSRLRPDIAIVSVTTMQIYEIKSEGNEAAAIRDACGYVNLLRTADVKKNAYLGIPDNQRPIYGPTRPGIVGIPRATPFGMLSWRSPSFGAIIYKYRTPEGNEQEDQVAAMKDKLKEDRRFALRVANSWYERKRAKMAADWNGSTIGPAPERPRGSERSQLVFPEDLARTGDPNNLKIHKEIYPGQPKAGDETVYEMEDTPELVPPIPEFVPPVP